MASRFLRTLLISGGLVSILQASNADFTSSVQAHLDPLANATQSITPVGDISNPATVTVTTTVYLNDQTPTSKIHPSYCTTITDTTKCLKLEWSITTPAVAPLYGDTGNEQDPMPGNYGQVASQWPFLLHPTGPIESLMCHIAYLPDGETNTRCF